MSSSAVIFVRALRDAKFLSREGAWVVSFQEAATFSCTWEAVDFCKKKSIGKAEIVMRIGEPLYDVKINLA